MLKVNVPAFKFEKARDYDKMYEDAFEIGEKSFDDQFKKRPRKLKPANEGDDVKVPSLLKPEDNRSGLRSGKLKPIDDKLKNSRQHDKQNFIKSQSGNVLLKLFRWSGSTTSRRKNCPK